MIKDTFKEVILLTWPTLVIVLSIIIILRIAFILKSERSFAIYEEIFKLLFIAYVLVLFELVSSQDVSIIGGTNLVPFREIFRYKFGSVSFYKQVVGNIVLFIPLGYFASYYCKIKKISIISLVVMLISLIIESVQHFIGRSFDVDDILLNVVGGIIGFLIYISLSAIERHMPELFRKNWFKNIICIILMILICVFIYKSV